jgi:putative oxidoreductase
MNKIMSFLTDQKTDIGITVLRMAFGVIMLTHGIPKWINYGNLSESFPDPLGLGSSMSMALVIFAEVICSVFLVIGFVTRITVIPLIINMLVAAFVVHGDDPFPRKEMALLYLLAYLSLLFTGGGKYSLDEFLFRKK